MKAMWPVGSLISELSRDGPQVMLGLDKPIHEQMLFPLGPALGRPRAEVEKDSHWRGERVGKCRWGFWLRIT
jgi:hypothetical protein